MDNFAEVLAENQSKNMSRISTEIGMQVTVLMKAFQHIRLRSSQIKNLQGQLQ